MEDSDCRTIKLVIAGIFGALFIIIAILAATGNLVSASQLIQEAVYKGTGTIDVEILGENQNARAASHNSPFRYAYPSGIFINVFVLST